VSGVRRAALGTCVATLTLLGAATAHAAFPGPNGQLATATNDVNTVFPDGSGFRAVVPGAGGPAWSSDGRRLAWTAPSNPTSRQIYVGNPDGSGAVQVTFDPGAPNDPAWSPDGTTLAFGRNGDIWTIGVDGTNQTNLTNTTTHSEAEPVWSPDGTKIAFARIAHPPPATDNFDIYVMNPDGTGVTQVTTNPDRDWLPDWAPDGSRIAYKAEGAEGGGIFTIDADGTGRTLLVSDGNALSPTWSPDGAKIAYTSGGQLRIRDLADSSEIAFTAGGDPDWQPLLWPGYARPKSASPVRLALVPTYFSCFASNRTHGPPLAFPSCSPPIRQSVTLTVGTPDANGAGANSVASARFAAIVGDPGTPGDQADLAIALDATDVRCAAANTACPGGALSDFAGQVLLTASLRLTDRLNGPTLTGTAQDITLRVPLSCAATPDPGVGSTCTLATTMESITPGSVAEGSRGIWQTRAVEVYDPGPNGTGYASCPPTCGDGDETVFLRQGVFVP
jgi:Tol biopolymer transport system component